MPQQRVSSCIVKEPTLYGCRFMIYEVTAVMLLEPFVIQLEVLLIRLHT